VDWTLNPQSSIPTILTIGRQPSSDGLSYQFGENGVRKSTYSALTFDGAADGVTATFNFSKYLNGTSLRLAYGKGYQGSENPMMADTPALKDTTVKGVIFETKLPSAIAKDSVFQIGFVDIDDMIADYSDLVVDDNSSNQNIGDMDLAGAMLELQNVGGSNLDFFIHVATNNAKPNGETSCLNVDKSGNCRKMGLLSSSSTTSTKTGQALWTGLRYTIHTNHKIGLEYNQGSKNWIAMTQGATNPYNKLSTRGKAYELYYIYAINRYAHLKLGGVYIDYEYTGSNWHVGEPMKIDDLPATQKAQTLDELRDYYLQFVVNF
jgi:opacity protein-like surface antigen